VTRARYVFDKVLGFLRAETPDEVLARREEKRKLRAQMIAAYRSFASGIRGFLRKDPERHYTLNPLDAPHPKFEGVQFVRVRLDDKSKDLPVKKRPVVGGPSREYAFVRAGYGQGARVRRAREGRKFSKARVST
jgi:hypothetical protein